MQMATAAAARTTLRVLPVAIRVGAMAILCATEVALA